MKNDLAGLLTLISVHRLDIIMLQEVGITDEQINQQLGNHGFTGMIAIDPENPSTPGTALDQIYQSDKFQQLFLAGYSLPSWVPIQF